MIEVRCTKYDLIAYSCAHCLGIKSPEAEEAAGLGAQAVYE